MIGVGSLQAELELLGAQFAGRGAIADDAIRAIRAAWGSVSLRHEGIHFRFPGLNVDPCGSQESLPVWVGGRSGRSLRRALSLADGWVPFGLVFPPEPPLDPVGAPAETEAIVRSYIAVGATGMNLRFRHRSRAHYCEQLEAMPRLLHEMDL